MKKITSFILAVALLALPFFLAAQQPLTHADTLRGSLTPARTWWDVQRYDITVTPDYATKTIIGKTVITYRILKQDRLPMQLDLQQPLQIDSIVHNKKKIDYTRNGDAWFVQQAGGAKGTVSSVEVYYSGKVHEAIRAPWDGGWIWGKDSLNRPWMTVACQGLGASVWYPCKDHQSDEPDKGASLTMIVPDTLIAVANGRLQSKQQNSNGTATYKWAVVNPINTYCIIPYIGKYVNFKEVYAGEKGNLDVNYWVLDYNLARAKSYMPPEVHNTLRSFEYWMGPYPFYEDGYQLIEASHTGMEHQSAVSYGNWYKPGYRGRDLSGTGWGMKWDFIIVHESGHEWFGNNITSKDLADMWVHESFTNYSETLFIGRVFGEDAADAYNAGTRKGIQNDKPIIARFDVNEMGSGDMYPKGGNMLHSIRHGLNNDALFRKTLRGLNSHFYHQVVTGLQVQQYISSALQFNYSNVFDQYLRTTQVPVFEFYFSPDGKKLFYRYSNCVKGFNLPIFLKDSLASVKLFPTDSWKQQALTQQQAALITEKGIEAMYYVKPVRIK